MAIDFDTDNEGGYLDVTTNDVDGGGFGQQFIDASGGGIRFGTVDAASLQLTGGGGVLMTDDSDVGMRWIEDGNGGMVINNVGTADIIVQNDGTSAKTVIKTTGGGPVELDADTADVDVKSRLDMNTHKIVGVDTATASGDALPYGQAAGGDLTGTYPNPTLASGVGGKLLYEYTVAGSDKTSIDTNVDGAMAGSLSGSYRVLEIFTLLRTDEAVTASVVNLQLNNDTAGNYDEQRVTGANTTASAAVALAGTAWQLSADGASSAANYFGAAQVTIPYYAATVAYKRATALVAKGDSTAANDAVAAWSFAWKNTAAITRVALTPNTAGKKLKIGSTLLVYAR